MKKQKFLSFLAIVVLLIFNQACLGNSHITVNNSGTGNLDSNNNSSDNSSEDLVISVGDFFCISTNSSGNLEWYIVSKDTDAADIPQEDVAGIVFSTDVSRIGEEEKAALLKSGVSPHGLVIAVKNATSGVVWGPSTIQVNSNSNLVSTNAQSYVDIEGKANTQTVWSHGSYNSSDFPGFYAIQQCNSGLNSNVPRAPSNTTGWYLPSVGQLWDFIENLAQFPLSGYRQDSETYLNITNASSVISNLDASIEKLEDADSFTSRISGQLGYFATSSEVSAGNIKALAIYSTGQIYFNSMAKAGVSTGYDIRPVLAF